MAATIEGRAAKDARVAADAFRNELVQVFSAIEAAPWEPTLKEVRRELRKWLKATKAQPDTSTGPWNYELVHSVQQGLHDALYEWTVLMGQAIESASQAFDVLEDFWTSHPDS
jgi:hypothetical protein